MSVGQSRNYIMALVIANLYMEVDLHVTRQRTVFVNENCRPYFTLFGMNKNAL